jgi:hypothetical protein
MAAGGFLAGKQPSQGTQLALGIVLLWFGGLCLFVAFMSGKIAALTASTDSTGTARGPADASGLVSSLAKAVQAAEIGIPQPGVGQTLPITGLPQGQTGTVTNLGGGDWVVGNSTDF